MTEYMERTGTLRGIHFDDSGFRIKAFLPGISASDVTGGLFVMDSRLEDITIGAVVKAKDVKDGCTAVLTKDLNGSSDFAPLRWTCCFTVRDGGNDKRMMIRNTSKRIRHSLKIRNIQSRIGNGYIIYPYIGLKGIFKLCYREENDYDTASVRAREITALGIYTVAGKLLRRRNYYLIYEKFSKTAQDNSYYFFRYCMTELPEEEKKKFYYVIDKKSGDYQYVCEFEPQIIQFMSLKHMVLAMAVKLCISTDSTPHLYAWQTKPSFVFSRIRKKPVLFLQHGVTAMKKVDVLFGKHGSSPMKYFVATSEIEQDIVVENFGYERDDVPITGFTRWDALEDRTDPNDRFILIMPTWRVWLEDVVDEDFVQSDYYKRYRELLTSSRLTALLESRGLRVILYLHPKFARYIGTFSKDITDRIELITFGSHPLNDIMMRASMLITDYSSVCWDMLYMDRPVVFYQFDTETYLKAHGSYIDLEHDLPGPRETEFGPMMDAVEAYAENGFKIQDEYEEKLMRFFAYRDKNNCERTYNFLREREE